MRSPLPIRIPIFIKLLSFSCVLVVAITFVIGFFIVDVQKKQFEKQLTQFSLGLLRIVIQNAPDKILAEEDLALFKLVKDISENEQVLAVGITDQNNRIIAHSNIERVNKSYSPPKNLQATTQIADNTTLSTILYKGRPALYLEAELFYQDIRIGHALMIVSQDRIIESIEQSKRYIMATFVAIMIFAFIFSLGFSLYFSRPIKKLEKSVFEFGSGNFKLRTHVKRNDELGDLALAFNQMAADIEAKEKIKDSFGRYVAPEIVDMVLANPTDHWMKADTRTATVLFTDIRGFTALSENREPEEVVDMLNDHFTLITDIIVKHGGQINKFVGDAAMAIFGMTKSQDNHAAEAVHAAFEIMDIIEKKAGENNENTGVLRIGIGINTGPMVAGNLGSQKKMEYTVIGDNVNIASRLTAIAPPGEILITGKTFDVIKNMDHIKATPISPIGMKGKKNITSVYTLTLINKKLSNRADEY